MTEQSGLNIIDHRSKIVGSSLERRAIHESQAIFGFLLNRVFNLCRKNKLSPDSWPIATMAGMYRPQSVRFCAAFNPVSRKKSA